MLTGRSINPLDPQPSEHAFLNLTVTIGILSGFGNRLFGNAIDSASGTVIPFSRFHHLFMATVCGDTSFLLLAFFNPQDLMNRDISGLCAF